MLTKNNMEDKATILGAVCGNLGASLCIIISSILMATIFHKIQAEDLIWICMIATMPLVIGLIVALIARGCASVIKDIKNKDDSQ